MTNESVERAVAAFALEGKVISCERYGEGHINDTFKIVCDGGRWYILQHVNRHVFKNPDELMENIARVTEFLQAKLHDPRRALNLVSTHEGKKYYVDVDGEYFRVYDFVMDSICLQSPESPQDFYESAVGFGNFQKLLADFPAEQLHETIVNFHNTPVRFENLRRAVENDVCDRAKTCRREIEGFLSREEDGRGLMALLKSGQLPLKVTHNDTKLNNVMLDDKTKKAICVIDLDTVMPGLVAFDFGDSIRFGASTAAEDETDLSKVSMSLELFRTYAQGFIGACGDALTETEIETLPLGAKLMTLECGARFLTDYLEGDKYFRIHHDGHNLERCRTQLKLVEDMEQKWEEMNDIINDVAGKK